jgi:hypothetical protein
MQELSADEPISVNTPTCRVCARGSTGVRGFLVFVNAFRVLTNNRKKKNKRDLACDLERPRRALK